MRTFKNIVANVWAVVFAEAEDGALIDLSSITEGAVQKYDDNDFDAIASAGYLARLQLMTSNSAQCKSGAFPINHYALVSGQSYQDLGESLDILVIAWRPKALDTSDGVITAYDKEDKEFQRIVAASDVKDSGCMFGPEFLVYIPSIKEFATFFFGSKSGRREAPAVRGRMHKAATMKAQECKGKSHTWFSPTTMPCTTPFEQPDMDKLQEELQKFNNPPKSEIETAEGEERDR